MAYVPIPKDLKKVKTKVAFAVLIFIIGLMVNLKV